MSEKCKICGAAAEGKMFLIISGFEPIPVCNECLNDYDSHNYNRLVAKLERNYGKDSVIGV